jgi:hypothetical protein
VKAEIRKVQKTNFHFGQHLTVLKSAHILIEMSFFFSPLHRIVAQQTELSERLYP